MRTTPVGIHFADRTVSGTAVRLRPNVAVVETEARLPYGTRVTVMLPDVAVEGIVRWSSERNVGIQFDRPRAREVRALHRLMHRVH